MLHHHGLAVGLRHARKHLRASVDLMFTAAEERIASRVARLRQDLLTTHSPATVAERIEALYDLADERIAA